MRTTSRLVLAMMILFMGFTPARGEDAQTHPFSVHDMLAMERVSSPAASPDGSTLAFSVRTTDLEANRGRSDLWTVNLDGSNLRQLTTNPENDTSPLWSPDGKWIYFLSSRSGKSQVWRIATHGGEAEPVTDEPLDVGNLKLSPDGKTVAYTMEVFVDCPDVDCTVKKLKEIEDRPYTGRVYDRLFVRHWDTWEDGRRSHLFARSVEHGPSVDVSASLDGDTPSQPFGGPEEIALPPTARPWCSPCAPRDAKRPGPRTTTSTSRPSTDRKRQRT